MYAFVNYTNMQTCWQLKAVPELKCSKAASFCDFFLEGKERNEVIEFWSMILYIFNEYKKDCLK